MKKMFLINIIVLLFVVFDVSGFQITEIMFNPNGTDTGKEWIEIKLNSSDECINLTEYKLFEEGANHNIYKNTSDIFCKYAIISSDINKFSLDYSYINFTDNISEIEVYKSTFSLSNTGENIAIKKGTEIIDEINYSLLLENIFVKEGDTVEFFEENNVSFWRSSSIINGNPGDLIKVDENSFNTSENSTIEINTTINETISENNSNNNSSNNTNNNCDINISIVLKNISTIYENEVSIKFYNKISKSEDIQINYSIEYWVEDLFGNIIKNKVVTTNQDEKSFTPKIDDFDKILLIRNNIKNISCDISNNSLMSGEKIILIKNSKYVASKQTCPVCSTSNAKPVVCEECTCAVTNNTQSPIIKIINVCNTSKEVEKIVSQNSFGLNTVQTNNNNYNNSNKTSSQSAGKATSMIIYESPNLKNRLYALIGFILVGLTCIGFVGYKIYRIRTVKDINK